MSKRQRVSAAFFSLVLAGCGGGSDESVSIYDGPPWVTRAVGLNGLTAAAWNGAKYVAITSLGETVSSTDGIGWNTKTPASGAGPNDVVWGNGLFVSAGNDGHIHTSPDGVAWTQRDGCGCSNHLLGVAWSGSMFAAVGYGGRISTSPNGVDWAPRNSGVTADDTFADVAASPTTFVAVGYDKSSSPLVRYSTDGQTWTAPTFDIAPTFGFSYATWDGSKFIITGGGKTYSSTDGSSWTYVGAGIYTGGIVWDGSKYLAAINGGTKSSADLTSWSDAFIYTNHSSKAIVHAAEIGQYLLVGYNYASGSTSRGWIATSGDGASWTVQVGSDSKTAVIWDGGRFMALDDNGRVFTSTDGIDWSSNAGIAISYGPGVCRTLVHSPELKRYVAGCGSKVWSSENGSEWTQRYSNSSMSAQSVIWTGTKFLLVGWGGSYLVSSDGITWDDTTKIVGAIDASPGLEGIAWSGALGRYVAVASDTESSVYTSPDGTMWTELGVATPWGLNGVVWTGTRFIAVGDGGVMLTSSNGAAWDQSPAAAASFNDIKVISGKVVMVDVDGGVYVSTDDGTTWTKQATDTTAPLHAVAGSPTRMVAVGSLGTVISQ